MRWPRPIYRQIPRRHPMNVGFSRYSVALDGASYISRAIDPILQPSLPYSFMCAAYVTDFSVRRGVAVIRGRDRAFVIMETDGHVEYEYRDAAFAWHTAVSAAVMPTGRWVVLTAVLMADGSNTRVDLYRDLTSIYGATLAGQPVSGTNSFDVGRSEWGGYAYILGYVDTAILYGRALTLSDIEYNIMHPHSPRRDDMLLWWAMEEGAGNTVGDLSGNGLDGALQVNAAWRENEAYKQLVDAGL